jgi:hypothetical protein
MIDNEHKCSHIIPEISQKFLAASPFSRLTVYHESITRDMESDLKSGHMFKIALCILHVHAAGFRELQVTPPGT